MAPRQLLCIAALLLISADAIGIESIAQPFVGVSVQKVTRSAPRPLRLIVARIDLTADGISFRVTPGNGDPNGDEPGDPNNETTRETTLAFLTAQRAQLAINGAFFGMGSVETDNLGLVVSEGERVSPFRSDWPAFNLDRDNRATIVYGEQDSYQVDPRHAEISLYNALSGSDQIVTNAAPTTDDREFSTTPHPRTAIGYSPDKELVLVVVDGRQAGVSEGMTLAELAQLMVELGCVNAINLDGGGSTTMAIADPAPRVLNVPSSKSGDGRFGILRKNGASLAIFAKPSHP